MQFHLGKKKTNKKATRVCMKVYPWKTHETKIPRPATKEDNNIIVSSWSQIQSPIDTVVTAACLSDILKECKSLATTYKYRLCSHSLQQSRHQYTYSFFSRPAKPAGGFKQLLNKLCMSFWMATEWMVLLHCSYFCDGAKNPNSFCSHYLRVF